MAGWSACAQSGGSQAAKAKNPRSGGVAGAHRGAHGSYWARPIAPQQQSPLIEQSLAKKGLARALRTPTPTNEHGQARSPTLHPLHAGLEGSLLEAAVHYPVLGRPGKPFGEDQRLVM